MPARTQSVCTAPRTHRQRLSADEVGRVDDEDLGRGEVAVERGPGPLQEQDVAGGERRGGGEVLALPLDGEDDEVAARRDHAREEPLADQRRARGDHHLGEARGAVEEVVLDLARVALSSRSRRPRSEASAAIASPSPRTTSDVVGLQGPRRAPCPSLSRTVTRVTSSRCGELERRPRRADQRRAGGDAELVEAGVEAELLDEGAGVGAEVGRQHPALAVRAGARGREDGQGDAADDEGHADPGELEVVEALAPGLERGLEHEDVHRRAGQRQHRAAMGAEDQRHQQLRRRVAQADGGDDDHREQRGDGAVDADQRREHAAEQHGERDQAVAAGAGAGDEDLTGPGGDAGLLQRGADHEERGDEHRRGIAEAGEALVERQDARRPQRHRAADADDDDRQAVPDEQADDAGDDAEDDPDLGQRCPSGRLPRGCAVATSGAPGSWHKSLARAIGVAVRSARTGAQID